MSNIVGYGTTLESALDNFELCLIYNTGIGLLYDNKQRPYMLNNIGKRKYIKCRRNDVKYRRSYKIKKDKSINYIDDNKIIYEIYT